MGCNDMPHTHGHAWVALPKRRGSPQRFQCSSCGACFHDEMECLADRCEGLGWYNDAAALREMTEPSRFHVFAEEIIGAGADYRDGLGQ